SDDWSYQAEEEPTNYALMAFSSSSSSFDIEVPSCSKACSKAFAQLHSQYDKLTDDFCKSQFDVILYQTGTFMPPKPDLVFNTAPIAVETDHPAFTVQLSPTKPAQDLSHTNRPTAPIIEDWVSDFKDESETKASQIVPSFVQSSDPKPASSGKRRNRKACFVCKSVDHLIKDCDYHAKKMAQPTPRNHAHRGNHKQYAPLTHINPQKHMVHAATLTQSKPVSITAVRPVSAAVPKFRVTQPRHAKTFVTKSKSPIRRHLTRSPSPLTSNLPPRVTAVKALVVSATQWNVSYLSDFEELNGGYFAFGGNPKGGKISGKEKVKTKNKHNIAVSGPTWLFDIGSLTRTMNYQPVTARNQTNLSVSFQDKFDVEKAREEIDQQYVLFPVWSSGSTNPQNNDGDAAFDGKEHDFDAKKPESEVNVSPSSSTQSRKQDDKTKKEAKGKIPTVGQNSPNSTNTFSAAGPSNVAASPTYGKSSFIDASQLPNDPDMLELEDITYSDDEDDVGAEADFNNLKTSIIVSPIPTTRVHKDHPVSQIIGDLSSTTQTRSMTRVVQDQHGLLQMFNDDFHTSMFAYFLLQEEPKRVHQAIKYPSWIEAMQEGLGFEDIDHPDKVYKVVKALYGLHQAPKAWFQPSDGYHVVPSPYTRTFMPPKPDLVSDFEDESKTKAPQIVPSFVQSSEKVKSPRHYVQHAKTTILATTPKPASPKPASSGKRRNRKSCFVYKSVDHLIKDCDYHAKKMAQPTPKNHAHKSKPVSITAVKPVSAAVLKFRVTQPRHAKPFVTKSKSPVRRHLTRSYSPKTSNSPPRVTTVRASVGNPQHALKDNGVIDSGYLRHMTGNMSYLSDFKELNGRYVAFGGNPKGVARIEAIKLFLAYASFMGYMVYQMGVNSAFLYGTIKEEVYVCQPLRFEDPDHPNKVYKVVKAFYGLHQAPRAWYETLANYLLENGFQRGKINQTLFIKRQKGVNTPRSDEDTLELMELTVFLLSKVEKVGIGVNAVDQKVFAVRHM
nr:putative ribonuclease H-like domain-containing protein [Tanacetum cinerariifolium]